MAMRYASSHMLFVPALVALSAGCAAPRDYPSLAPRAAEGIDPRLPVASQPSPGTVEPGVATTLARAVATARGGTAAFAQLAARAETLAGAAGARESESWVVAQQALSALSAQHGVTTSAAADIDAIAAERIAATRWLNPATRAAIEAAAGEVGAISERQSATIDRLSARLAR